MLCRGDTYLSQPCEWCDPSENSLGADSVYLYTHRPEHCEKCIGDNVQGRTTKQMKTKKAVINSGGGTTKILLEAKCSSVVVAHAFNSNALEAEASRSV